VWTWYALPRSADDDGSRAGTEPVELRVHTADVERNVTRIVKALGFAHSPEGRALISAARWHDFGKDRRVWQMSIWNNDYPNRVLAKPGRRWPPRDLSRYRHEFGSLLDVLLPGKADEWEKLTEEEQELVLHFIAAHHGRARPHFPEDEAFDPERPSDLAATVAREVPRRFARLQRKYGRWGLAYLESILRAADAAASAEPSETVKENADEVVEAAATGGAQ
jgi:CRISPR-associated endonuclease/helicase Cas3